MSNAKIDAAFTRGWNLYLAGYPRPKSDPDAIEGWDKAVEQNTRLKFRAFEKKAAKLALGV